MESAAVVSGVMLSFFASALPSFSILVCAVTMSRANDLTDALVALVDAILPASISPWLAAASIANICASVMVAAGAFIDVLDPAPAAIDVSVAAVSSKKESIASFPFLQAPSIVTAQSATANALLLVPRTMIATSLVRCLPYWPREAERGQNPCYMAILLRRMRQLDVNRQPHLVRHHDTASLQRLIPREAEVAPVDLERSAEPRPVIPPRILRESLGGNLHVHRARDVADGQITGHHELAVPGRLDGGAYEPDLRKFLHIEEVPRPKMRVSSRIVGRNARSADLRLDPRSRRIAIGHDGAGNVRKPPPDLRYHQMGDDELDSRMRRIDLPRAGQASHCRSGVAFCTCKHPKSPRRGFYTVWS